MARATQARKKLAFDPSELNDLIFSPAVGNGTASHLLFPSDQSSTVDLSYSPTVISIDGTTVVTTQEVTVVPMQVIAVDPRHTTTVDPQANPAVTANEQAGQRSTLDTTFEPTVDQMEESTVDLTLTTLLRQIASHTNFIQSNESTVDNQTSLNPSGNQNTVDPLVTTSVGRQDSISVPRDNETTVDPLLATTATQAVAAFRGRESASISNLWLATTVIKENLAPHGEDKQSRVVPSYRSTVDEDRQEVTPRAELRGSHLEKGSTVDPQVPGEYWFTKEGQPVKARQVRKIRRAQDAINSYEESVYKALWESRVVQHDSQDPDCKIVQAGYDHLCKQTRLAKKSIQRLMARLLEKDFIAIERPADIWTRTPTVYRVRTFKQVLRIHTEKGREYAAKIGIGMAYVYRTTVDLHFMSTVDLHNRTTVDSMPESTVVRRAPVTVDATPLSTVVSETTNIRRTTKQQRSTTTPTNLAESIEQLIPGIDQGAIDRIWREGREAVPDATTAEILFFLEERARILFRNRRLENPTGLLLSSIRDWLTERRVFARRKQQQEDAEELERITAEIEENLRGGRK